MLEDRRGRTKRELESKWCVSAFMKEGLSREDAKEKCARTGRTGDTHVSGVRFATDQKSRLQKSIGALTSYVTRAKQLGIDEDELMDCVLEMEERGLTEKEAQERCEAKLTGRTSKVPTSDSESGISELLPHFGKSDSLGIVNRDPTPLERCMSCRMDLYGETEEQARRTCTKMFNDPMYRHVFAEGDAWKMGTALFKWEYNHSQKEPYPSFRERDRQEQKSMDRHVAEIIREIQTDSKDPDYGLPGGCLKERATRIYRERQEGKQIKAARKARQEKMTVGSLYGKTKEQIIREQAGDTSQAGKDLYRMDAARRKGTVGNLYMKTQKQIIAEDSVRDQWSRYPEKKREYDRCVRERMADGMTRGEAEAHCLAATLPSDEPGPHAKKLRKGPM